MTKFAKQMMLTHLRYALSLVEASVIRSPDLNELQGDLCALVVQVEGCTTTDMSQPPNQLALVSL